MKEYPILFSTGMVRAILDGRKTQTRRIMKYQPTEWDGMVSGPEMFTPLVIDRHGDEVPGNEIFGVYGEDWHLKFPYGKLGDHLWVKEKWAHDDSDCDDVHCGNIDHIWRYANEEKIVADSFAGKAHWRSSRFMPRWASRITLEIFNVRVERVQDISESDAVAEGYAGYEHLNGRTISAKTFYAKLWDDLNSKRGFGWDVNPWVWVIEFNRIEE